MMPSLKGGNMDEDSLDYKVYIKINDNSEITEVNSSAFLTFIEGWIEIDSGCAFKNIIAQRQK